MAYPICGKCKSRGVYSDRNENGQLVVCCMMCGNRSNLKAGKGFYMSDKRALNGFQSSVKNKNANAVGAAETLSEFEQIIIEMYQMFERMTRRIIK